jgi:hypothetical protein
MDFVYPYRQIWRRKKFGPSHSKWIFLFFGLLKLIYGQEDMIIKKGAFSTLVVEFFCSTKYSC